MYASQRQLMWMLVSCPTSVRVTGLCNMVSMPWSIGTSSPSAFSFAIDRELCKDISVVKTSSGVYPECQMNLFRVFNVKFWSEYGDDGD
jgi:hypothetical protein